MKWVALVAVLLFYAILHYMNADYEAAMAACQVEHSFDTCFYSLNH
jgi:hypothetical protein